MTNRRTFARQRLRLRENQLFLALTIVVGVLAGLSAVLFTLAIERVAHLLFGLAPSRARLLLIPPLVGTLTGILLAKVFPDVRGSGVPQTKAAFHLHGGAIPWRVPFGKFITGALCIGSGHSMGRESPSVQIGAGLASVIGRWVGLPPSRIKDLVPVGAAGALAAAFNPPVAAVIFALEEIIGDMNAGLLGSTVVASVASVIVERALLGNEPLFRIPTYHLVHPAELAAYATLGVAGGIVSVVFCKGLLGARELFRRLPSRTRIWQPALGGLLVGAVLIVVPQVIGVGYEYVDQALNNGLALKTLVLLCAVKLAATIISYASGNAGGIFAPTLYIGAMAGGAVGLLVRMAAPFPTGDPGAYALVGMGTLFAGIIRAPMTSVFMIFEITQDYQILVPLMVANLLSFMISRHYQRAPVYEALLRQDGVHLPSPETTAAPRTWTAADVMAHEASFIDGDSSVEAGWQRMNTWHEQVALVGSRDAVTGTITRDRLMAAMEQGLKAERLASLVDTPVVHAHPDHPLDVVLERLAQTPGLLAIVSRDLATRLEGVVTFDQLTRVMRSRSVPLPVDDLVPGSD